MTEGITGKLFLLLVILLVIPWPVACVQSSNCDTIGSDTSQILIDRFSTTLNPDNTQENCCNRTYPIPEIGGYINNNASGEFPLKHYVTPADPAVKALATQINGVKDAYELAVQWTYVSDRKLSNVANEWLTPHEFLANTPNYPTNPDEGEKVSDCEEQAHSLVSLIRALGIPPEDVRVALGDVRFGDEATGHAWVELLTNGHWLALDPSSGPYWDDQAEKLVRRRGRPFNYYASHTYPVAQVWAYYNDVYYFSARDNSGNAPASWHETDPAG